MEKIIDSPYIEIEERWHYGNLYFYVVSAHAEALQKLTGRKTLTGSDIEALKALGFTVTVRGTEAKTL